MKKPRKPYHLPADDEYDAPPRPPGKKALERKAEARLPVKTQAEVEAERLESVLARFKIVVWDYLIVGDGSGSNWKYECGWASAMVERATSERTIWAGTMNRGTVNVAEIMAYAQPLNWLDAAEEERKKKRGHRRPVTIHIITDSQYCQGQGSSKGGATPAKNSVLWAAMACYARKGFTLHWHWAKRGTVGLNILADELSKSARTGVNWDALGSKITRASPDGDLRGDVYVVNPSEGPLVK